MKATEVLNGLKEIMKADGWRGKNNMYLLIGGNLSLEGEYPQLDGLIIAANELELWDFSTFKDAYENAFGKRKSPKPANMVEVSVGVLLRETDKAYQFSSGKMTNRGSNGPELAGIWVPKSQIQYNEQTGVVAMPSWLAKETNWMQGR